MIIDDKEFISPKVFWERADLLSLVEQEAKLIKKNFTSEEINKLTKSRIDGDSEHRCVYGTMVGTCNSQRVMNFIQNNLDTLIISQRMEDFNSLSEVEIENRSYNYFLTPLEEYIISQEHDEFDEDQYNISVKDRINHVINLITS